MPERAVLVHVAELPTWITACCCSPWCTGSAAARCCWMRRSPLSHGAGARADVSALAGGGLALYEVLCRLPGLARPARWFRGAAADRRAAWGLAHVFTPRAAFLLVGAMIGTIMAGNVFLSSSRASGRWSRPRATAARWTPAHGVRAKERSTHNHYLTLPVLFTMLSNHFPALYGSAHAWAVLALLVVAGAGGQADHEPAASARRVVFAVTSRAWCRPGACSPRRPGRADGARARRHAPVDDADGAARSCRPRCVTCHASRPSNAVVCRRRRTAWCSSSRRPDARVSPSASS